MSSTPPLPSSEPPQQTEESKEKWILNEDIEVTQFLPSESPNPEDLDPTQVASQLRLEADIEVQVVDDNLLKPAHVPKRRRSPVTVQEWVASLPIPHLLERPREEPEKEDDKLELHLPLISLPSQQESPGSSLKDEPINSKENNSSQK